MLKSRSLIPKINKSSWITLNVGGQQFLTTKHTLLRKESIFRQFIVDEPSEKIPMYQLAFWKKAIAQRRNKKQPKLSIDLQAYYQIRRKSDNEFYLDRDPTCFAVVLNYMRHGKLIYTKDVSITGIMEEASYFQVVDLIETIEEISGIKRADLPRATPLYMPQRTIADELYYLQEQKKALEQQQEQAKKDLEELEKAIEEEKKELIEEEAISFVEQQQESMEKELKELERQIDSKEKALKEELGKDETKLSPKE